MPKKAPRTQSKRGNRNLVTPPLSRTLNTSTFAEPIAKLMPLFSGDIATRIQESIRVLRGFLSAESFSPSDLVAFAHACRNSQAGLPGYSTLDSKHIEDIDRLISLMDGYIHDTSKKRPLNFLMLASPGTGKSHFIDCIASKLSHHNVYATTFNMASMSTVRDLLAPLDEVRSAKVDDKIPLLFLDEVDSDPKNYNLLLPLLWDGSLNLGQRDLKLGKLIVVLAASSQLLPSALEEARSMKPDLKLPDGANSKAFDMLSRINGSVVRIPSLEGSRKNIDRPLDKIAIAVHMLTSRFGDSLQMVSVAFLRLIHSLTFRYDTRSLAHFLDCIPKLKDPRVLSLSDVVIPLSSVDQLKKSSLVYHLVDEEGMESVVSAWHRMQSCRDLVRINLNPLPIMAYQVPSVMEWYIASAIAETTELLKITPKALP